MSTDKTALEAQSRASYEAAKEVADAVGLSPREVLVGMDKAETDDPCLGAAYLVAGSHAVVRRGDKHAQIMREAESGRGRILRLVEKARLEEKS